MFEILEHLPYIYCCTRTFKVTISICKKYHYHLIWPHLHNVIMSTQDMLFVTTVLSLVDLVGHSKFLLSFHTFLYYEA